MLRPSGYSLIKEENKAESKNKMSIFSPFSLLCREKYIECCNVSVYGVL